MNMIGGVFVKKIFKYVDKPLLVVSVFLFIIGLIMIFSASNVTAYMRYATTPYYYFLRQALFLLVGIVMFLFMVRFNTKFYGILSGVLLIAIISSLFALLIVGKAKNQAVSWFDLGFFSFQPSEFAKIISIVWMANYYEEKRDKLDSYFVSLFPVLVCGVVAALIFAQPDLGTTIIYLVIVAAVFMSEPIPKIIKTKLVIIVFGGLLLMGVVVLGTGKSLILERQLARFHFTRPCDRLLTDGNQVCNGYIAINNGGLWGKGLGNSTQKYLYLPEPYTDFIFTIIVEELGSIIGIFIILMYVFLLYRILMIGRRSYTNRGCAMCYGVSIYIFCHIVVNLLGIMGLMPMTGVPLPFMSYGGSFTICLIAGLTVVQRVSVETGIRNHLNVSEKKRKV